MNKEKKGYIIVVENALTQTKTYSKLTDVILDPEAKEPVTMGQVIEKLYKQNDSLKKQNESLEKENKKLKAGLEKTIRALASVNLKK